jgi:multiple antibiotic resistance protein
MLLLRMFLLALTALLPLINPIGSALVFVGLVGEAPQGVYLTLARKVALASFAFLVVVEFLGEAILSFFGISLPIVQVTGGLVIAATAWALLFEKDANAAARGKHMEIAADPGIAEGELDSRVFYPFTFPITAGPGTLVVMVTLSARSSMGDLAANLMAHAGILLASVVIAVSIYFCYGYGPRLIKLVSASTVHGVLRVIAFILMCIGVQITWNGVARLVASITTH